MRFPSNRLYESNRQNGNATVLALVALTVLAGLSMAQFTVTRKNFERSDFFLSRTALRRYAESGLVTALHHLKFDIDGGQIGVLGWDATVDDLGADGISATLDDGEGDGLPTPGEPNLNPVSIGPAEMGVSLLAYVSDSGVPGVKSIVAITFNDEDRVVLEWQVQSNVVSIPKNGPLYIDPAVPVILNGNNFLIDGHDTDPDDTPGPGPDQFGLATSQGAIPGDNQALLLSQIGVQQLDNIQGQGGEPSIGETVPVDVDALFTHYATNPDQTVPPGSYSGVTWGDWALGNMVTTYVDGDLHLSGGSSSAGVIVVSGDLTLSSDATFAGLIIAKGDVRITGLASVYGSIVIPASGSSSLTVAGSAELLHSSAAIQKVEASSSQSPGYQTVYYGER